MDIMGNSQAHQASCLQQERERLTSVPLYCQQKKGTVETLKINSVSKRFGLEINAFSRQDDRVGGALVADFNI